MNFYRSLYKFLKSRFQNFLDAVTTELFVLLEMDVESCYENCKNCHVK